MSKSKSVIHNSGGGKAFVISKSEDNWELPTKLLDILVEAHGIKEKEAKCIIEKSLLPLISETEDRVREEQIANIGMLRQWLNEDRITDPKKMVTNEELKFMLTNSGKGVRHRHYEYPPQAGHYDGTSDSYQKGKSTPYSYCECGIGKYHLSSPNEVRLMPKLLWR